MKRMRRRGWRRWNKSSEHFIWPLERLRAWGSNYNTHTHTCCMHTHNAHMHAHTYTCTHTQHTLDWGSWIALWGHTLSIYWSDVGCHYFYGDTVTQVEDWWQCSMGAHVSMAEIHVVLITTLGHRRLLSCDWHIIQLGHVTLTTWLPLTPLVFIFYL